MNRQAFSKSLEHDYYCKQWPTEAKRYAHLEPYLRSWMDPALFAGKTILSLGAGECTYSRFIADRFAPRRVIASELFPERMRPAAHDNSCHALSFVAADSYRLPLRSASCDVVWGSLVLHQWGDLLGIVSEISRVLRRGGLYLGFEPNPFNPAIVYRYLCKPHSENQYLLRPSHLRIFQAHGFDLRTTFFYAKLPRLRNRFLTTCIGIQARKAE
jgi:SAM-dependent methyltransferase